MKKHMLLIFTVLLSVSLAAQNGKIKGKVLDESNQTLPGAGLKITRTNYTTVSDINGNYLFQEIPEGSYTIEVHYIGFKAAFSRRLDFLPSILSNLSFYGTYTYVKSKLEDIIFEGREDEDFSMGGTPSHTYNLSLA